MKYFLLITLCLCFCNGFSQKNTSSLKKLDSLLQKKEPLTTLGKGTKFPVFRGCQKIKDPTEAKTCTIKKIKNYIKLSYDLDIADRALPLEKKTQFEVSFVVNKKGKVEKVNAKANHRAIAIEAIKTAKRLPKFKSPGKVNGVEADTPMTMTMTIYF